MDDEELIERITRLDHLRVELVDAINRLDDTAQRLWNTSEELTAAANKLRYR